MDYAFPPDLDRLVSEKMATGLYASQEALLVDALHALDELDRRTGSFAKKCSAELPALVRDSRRRLTSNSSWPKDAADCERWFDNAISTLR